MDAFGKHDVEIELQTLTKFAQQVEALLAAMDGSEAAPYKLEAQKVTADSFVNMFDTAKFPEAVALNTAYNNVHGQLVKLHKDFAAQISAMKDAVRETHSRYSTNEGQTADAQNSVAKGAGLTPPSADSSGAAPKGNVPR
ncbi:hypothetical protein [Streptomyces rubellomurinus]|uniref:hypothetical protein n=1 Tax=Streptomyces rubellomurinus (strain ATCC 31215) TaxID=359131 RepID=UPI000696F7B4|nr:hypothetical protein [Streptomyces rubellomurinus]